MKSNKEIDIVGKVPSSLTAVGLSLIAIALASIIVTTYLLPYERKVNGTATLRDLSPSNDSIEGVLLLNLQEELPSNLMNISDISIQLQADDRVINATLLGITQIDSTNTYQVNCLIAPTDTIFLHVQELTATLHITPTSFLKKPTPFLSPINPH